ncbi:hypothetical protein EYV94_13100 [Puteibacter caeruleilacunae]|nr:hypothetical protein EYV94_13100 [Puteibacter caeruleilacunae]
MKIKNIQYTIVAIALSIVFLFSACDDSFLDTKSPNLIETSDTIYMTNSSSIFEVEMNFKNNNACKWRVAQFPKWLDIYPKEGYQNANESSTLHFGVNESDIALELGIYNFPLVFDINGEKMLEYTVSLANMGQPTMDVSTREISFIYDLKGSFEISNNNYGLLAWKIVETPDWISCDNKSGVVEQGSFVNVNVTANVDGLDEGDYSGVIKIQSNGVNRTEYEIKVDIKVSANIYWGNYKEGIFIDSRYSKSRDEVIVLTKEPNQLVFIGAETNKTIELNRVPQCFALSEDESAIAIGYSNAEISTYDTESVTETNTFQAGVIPSDVEFGNNQWLYFTAKISYRHYLHSLNLSNGEIIRANEGESGLTSLIKVPGKDLLAAYRPGYSPDGFFLFDISNAGETNKMNEYFMTHRGLCFYEDGSKMVTAHNKLFNTPEYDSTKSYFSNEPPAVGQLDLPMHQVSDCMAQHSVTERIFVGEGFNWEGENTVISIFNDHTLVKEKTIELKSVRPDNYPYGSTWYGKPMAMYPTSNGNALWVVQMYAEHSDTRNIWSVNKLEIEE